MLSKKLPLVSQSTPDLYFSCPLCVGGTRGPPVTAIGLPEDRGWPSLDTAFHILVIHYMSTECNRGTENKPFYSFQTFGFTVSEGCATKEKG